jgi:ribosomal protein S18 acetylase RimI-like enzyme
MKIRRAAEADLTVLVELSVEFEAEVPEMPHRGKLDLEKETEEIREFVRSRLALIAEDEEGPVGYALGKLENGTICYLDSLYVRLRARRGGVGKALMAEAATWGAAHGAQTMTLEVLASNVAARSIYERFGFREESTILFAPLDKLATRLTAAKEGPSSGVIHVQTDDVDAVVRAVIQFVPRLPGGSAGSVVVGVRNGWTAVHDELCDREPAMLRRLALELSDRMGAVVLAMGVEHGQVVRYVLFERGSVVDEYASVPEYHGPLPPGDVIALGANPTVVARLTGADPARVRAVARTAAAGAELSAPRELLVALAEVIGVEGASVTYAEARELPGAILLDRV